MQENDRYTFAEVKVFNTSKKKMNRTPVVVLAAVAAAAVTAGAE